MMHTFIIIIHEYSRVRVNRRPDWSSERLEPERIIVANNGSAFDARQIIQRAHTLNAHSPFVSGKRTGFRLSARLNFLRLVAVTPRVSKVQRGDLKFLEINLSEVFKAVFLSRSSSSSSSSYSSFFIYDSHKSTWIAGDSRNFHDTAGNGRFY